MPRVISYTPPWLSRPEPGSNVFSSSKGTLSSPHQDRRSSGHRSNGDASRQYLGPNRTIARRGTEIFVAFDNEIRWSDLCMLKDEYDERKALRRKGRQAREAGSNHEQGLDPDKGTDQETSSYRLLQASVSEKIRQLSISPNGSLLAIATSHTLHVAILPDSSKLGQGEAPIKLSSRMVGRTAHVLSQSPLASIIWHPYGLGGNCLITVTEDAVVRLWEFNFKDTISFDNPTLAVDLKKLAVGKTADQDYRPNRLNTNRTFSLDSLGMEVASACLGGRGSDEESPWCAMTLWIAMKEGDVYALCPVLPSKWQPSSTTVPLLSTQAMSKMAILQEQSLSEEEVQQCNDQCQWIKDLDSQQPFSSQTDHTQRSRPQVEIYDQPFAPGPIPRLQGPFQVFGDDDQDPEVTDIYVVAATVDPEELMDEEHSEIDSGLGLDEDQGLAASIVCLMTRNGRVHISLDIDGVQARWLPSVGSALQVEDEPSLILFEMVDTLGIEHVQATEWPTFSPDVDSPYAFFVTHSQGVYYLSLKTWIGSLQSELQSAANVGTAFRIEIVTNGPGTLRERLIDFRPDHESATHDATAAMVLQNPDIGYLCLTARSGAAHAVVLDRPDVAIEENVTLPMTGPLLQGRELGIFVQGSIRQPYIPPATLWERSNLPNLSGNHVQNRHKKALKEEIRLSSATLELITHAHRVLSEETHTLGLAAADLFRRCERLQDELRDQIERVKDLSGHVDTAIGTRSGGEDGQEAPQQAVEQRMEHVQARQEKLKTRIDKLSKKVRLYNRTPLSDQEKAFFGEITKINQSVPDTVEADDQDDEEAPPELQHRYNEAKRLAADMLAQAKETMDSKYKSDGEIIKVAPELRKEKVAQVMDLLDRESGLVDVALAKLERLSLVTSS